MREFFTAVIERNAVFDTDFATEPYECAWAAEARWFIQVVEIEGENPEFEAWIQVSPDGLSWCNEGSSFQPIREPGLYTIPVRNFGGWLRLDCHLHGRDSHARVMIHLVLKA